MKNVVLPEDVALCMRMAQDGTSEKEKEFFRNILNKEYSEIALSGDLLLSEYDNELEIYILRENFDEYRVGCAKEGAAYSEIYVRGIASLFSLLLAKIGFDSKTTLGVWLREREYSGINYKGNYDLQ